MEYLTTPDLLAIHQILIRTYGGSDGVRDMGALESALHRPKTGYYKDLIEECAALIESLAINHPFLDGNKRVAFAAGNIFLTINGYSIDSNSDAIYKTWIGFFDSQNFNFKSLDKWLRVIASAKDLPI